jgi:ATP-dependent Clp protease ATP-binding subunit ClpC
MSNEVNPEYLLVGLLRADESLRARLEIPTIDSMRNELVTNRHQRQPVTGLVLSEAARHVIVSAAEEREHLSHKHTGTEHLLLGIIRSGSNAAKTLEQREITVDRVRQVLDRQNLGIEWRKAELVSLRLAN